MRKSIHKSYMSKKNFTIVMRIALMWANENTNDKCSTLESSPKTKLLVIRLSIFFLSFDFKYFKIISSFLLGEILKKMPSADTNQINKHSNISLTA